MTWAIGRSASAIRGATGVELASSIDDPGRRAELSVQLLHVHRRGSEQPRRSRMLQFLADISVRGRPELLLLKPPCSVRDAAEVWVVRNLTFLPILAQCSLKCSSVWNVVLGRLR